MGELAAWLLGLALGFTARQMPPSRGLWIGVAVAAVVIGSLVTLVAGELWSEPWLILFDFGQVAVATVIGAYVLPRFISLLGRLRKVI
ncbi:MAG: hypothetical protein ACRED5_22470 [Propylenella sp.]